ncbi:MAG: C2 family cysteine protease [Pseudoclavibacter sp.]
MPAGMIGADTTALRAIGSRFVRHAERVRTARHAAGSAVTGVDWVGPDRDAYVDHWDASIDVALTTLTTAVDRIGAAEIPAQAAAQDKTSEAGGAGGSDTLEYGWWGDSLKPALIRIAHKNTDVDDPDRHIESDEPLDTDVDDMDPYDINQQGIGDCWALAPIAAVAHTDPEFLADNIEYDAATNEYIVTLYVDGEPVDVRVDNSYVNDVIDDENYLGVVGRDGEPNYASIYEKALAELRGGEYGDIWGGKGDWGLEAITGSPTVTYDFEDSSSSAQTHDVIQTQHDSGEAVVLSTRGDLGDNSPVVGGHVYTVTDVRDGGVVLYNPWGSNPESTPGSDVQTKGAGLRPGEIFVPTDELPTYFYEMHSTS